MKVFWEGLWVKYFLNFFENWPISIIRPCVLYLLLRHTHTADIIEDHMSYSGSGITIWSNNVASITLLLWLANLNCRGLQLWLSCYKANVCLIKESGEGKPVEHIHYHMRGSRFKPVCSSPAGERLHKPWSMPADVYTPTPLLNYCPIKSNQIKGGWENEICEQWILSAGAEPEQ